MGGCCARQQDMNFDKINSFQYSVDDIIKVNNSSKPELTFEENIISNKEEDIQLSKIIINMKNIFKEKVSTISLIELFNLAIYNKESFKNNEYIIFDMRRSSEQKEEFLKRIKHINYTYEQIKNIKNTNKYSKLKSFINNKKIIIIISEFYLNPKNNEENYRKVDEYPLILSQFLYDINSTISFKILNCCLSQINEISYTNKFEEYLSVFHSDEIIPYILFSYHHVSNLLKEGFFFISFSLQKIFSFEKHIEFINKIKIKENDNIESEDILKNKLLYDMDITSIIYLDEKNKENKENDIDIKEYKNKENIFKEIILKKEDLKSNKEKIINITNWLKQEVIQGHSCVFNIINIEPNQEENINDNKTNEWIYIIIIILCIVIDVDYESLINYFKEKIIYIDGINEILNNINKSEISDILSFLNNN